MRANVAPLLPSVTDSCRRQVVGPIGDPHPVAGPQLLHSLQDGGAGQHQIGAFGADARLQRASAQADRLAVLEQQPAGPQHAKLVKVEFLLGRHVGFVDEELPGRRRDRDGTSTGDAH